MPIDWQPFVEIVREHDTFLLTSHMRPDCDALGSELAMAHALRSLGKSARIVNGDAVPPHLAFIDPAGEIEVLGRDVSADALPPYDVLMVLDTSAWAQLGPMADVLRATAARRVIVDHHVSQDDLGAEDFKDPTAEATGSLVLAATEALGVEVSPAMAQAMFTAIATDTGWFRFNSVTERTFAAAAKLIAAGARTTVTFAALYEQNSIARLRLQGRILSNVKDDMEGRLVYSAVSLADLAETGAEPTDTEDVINRLLSVAGTEVALLFLEASPTETKVSLRSRSGFDVSAIAEQFGGGGHLAAAGVRYDGPLADAQTALLDAVRTRMG